MQDTPRIPSAPVALPIVIAKAIMEAITKISTAETSQGEDEATARRFKYASINDVLEACHETLIEVGLAIIPIEVEYREEWVDFGGLKQLWAHWGYQFRLMHKEGLSWIDERDVRHVSLHITGTGMVAGKAQSLALRDYYKGLLRIRTAEPEGDENEARNVSRETSAGPAGKSRKPAKQGAIPFDFGKGMAGYTPQEIKDLFDSDIATLVDPAKRQQWVEANQEGLKQLCDIKGGRATWLYIHKKIDPKAPEKAQE